MALRAQQGERRAAGKHWWLLTLVLIVGCLDSVQAQPWCPPGTVSRTGRNRAGNKCKPCPIGEYMPNYGKTRCLLCPMGTFANTTRSAACISCPAGTTTGFEGAVAEAQCVPAPSPPPPLPPTPPSPPERAPPPPRSPPPRKQPPPAKSSPPPPVAPPPKARPPPRPAKSPPPAKASPPPLAAPPPKARPPPKPAKSPPPAKASRPSPPPPSPKPPKPPGLPPPFPPAPPDPLNTVAFPFCTVNRRRMSGSSCNCGPANAVTPFRVAPEVFRGPSRYGADVTRYCFKVNAVTPRFPRSQCGSSDELQGVDFYVDTRNNLAVRAIRGTTVIDSKGNEATKPAYAIAQESTHRVSLLKWKLSNIRAATHPLAFSVCLHVRDTYSLRDMCLGYEENGGCLAAAIPPTVLDSKCCSRSVCGRIQDETAAGQ